MHNAAFDVMKFLRTMVKPAAGCTEIAAVGLATAIAYQALKSNSKGKVVPDSPDAADVRGVELVLDRNIFKNGYDVVIPNTRGKKGIDLAASLGLFLNVDIEKPSLTIFEQINGKILDYAEQTRKKVTIDIDRTRTQLYIKGVVHYAESSAEVVLCRKHDRICYIAVDGSVVYTDEEAYVTISGCEGSQEMSSSLTVEEICTLLDDGCELSDPVKQELQRTIDINKLLVEEGLLNNKYGIGVVKIVKDLIRDGLLTDDLSTKVQLQVAAAVEARLGGTEKPAMSSSGSGTTGVSATVPIIVVGEHFDIDKDRILKSILVSHLVVRAAADQIGELSALCGSYSKAVLGAAAGLAYLLGGGKDEIDNAIKTIASFNFGSICDGAKFNCTLKSMNAADIALKSALFSIRGMRVVTEGVIEESVDASLKNIGRISKSMTNTDDTIVSILVERGKKNG